MSGIETEIRRAFDEGRKEYGLLPLPFEIFARRAATLSERRLRRLTTKTGEVGEVFSRMAGADLFLSTACEEGVAGAWETFTERFAPRVRGLARRHGLPAREAEDLAADLPGDLLTPPTDGSARTRLGTFDGTGSLFGWLAVIVIRKIVDRARERAGGGRTGGPVEDLEEPRADREPDPAALAIDEETVRRLDAAFRHAWAGLTARETASVLFRYREGMPQKRIAEVLGVGEPRVSRLLSRAVEKLGSALRNAFPEGSEGARTDPDRLWRGLRDAVAGKMATSPTPPVFLGENRAGHGHERQG